MAARYLVGVHSSGARSDVDPPRAFGPNSGHYRRPHRPRLRVGRRPNSLADRPPSESSRHRAEPARSPARRVGGQWDAGQRSGHLAAGAGGLGVLGGTVARGRPSLLPDRLAPVGPYGRLVERRSLRDHHLRPLRLPGQRQLPKPDLRGRRCSLRPSRRGPSARVHGPPPGRRDGVVPVATGAGGDRISAHRHRALQCQRGERSLG